MRRLAWWAAAVIGSGCLAMLGAARAGDVPWPRVPTGFVAERAVADGAVRFPMFAAFDDRGRLFVAESSGLDLYAEIAAGTRKCRVSMLEDRDGDGRYELSRVFADGLVFPMGLAWRDGRLYVADPPDLVTLEDTNGDGRADRRTAILTGFGHTDNGSLHGLVFGPDGFLYMTMGMPDGYRLKSADGSHLEGRSGALIRCRPDGSNPEVVCRGFVNLIEAAFLPGGDAIGTDNWYQEPAGGFRDALVHLVEGGLYPYVSDQGTPQPVTGEVLPAVARFPAVALSGLERYRGTAYPAEYRGNLFSAQHNARRVGRHVLIPDGSSFRSEDTDFLTSDDPDFHPSDVLEDADGSLLVVDTGGWYVQHCPTGRIRQSQSRGGIYRIRGAGAPRPDDPRGQGLGWGTRPVGQLAELLADPRPLVRERAGRELTGRGIAAVVTLGGILRGPDTVGKVEAVWALAAIPDPAALTPLRSALADADQEVASAAARGLARRADRFANADLIRLVSTGHPRVRLAAAEALARCGDRGSLPALWRGLTAGPDRFLRHALVHAVHRLADAAALEMALALPDPSVQGAALLLLDQPPRPRGQLGPGPVVARLDSADPGLRGAALRVLMRHPEWSGEAIDHIRGGLRAADAGEAAALADLILAFQNRADVQTLLAGTATDALATADRRAWALRMMSRSRLSPLPEPWVGALAASIRDAEPAVRRAAVLTAAVLQVPRLDASLLALADAPNEPPTLRLEALRAALPRHPRLSPAAFDLLIGQLGVRDDPLAVLAAGELAGRAQLDNWRRLRLLEAIRGQNLITPPLLRAAFAPPLGDKALAGWVDYLEASLRNGWRPSDADLRALLHAVPDLPAGRRSALLRANAEGLRDRQARMAEYEPLLTGGDPVRGRAIFFGKPAACASCHRIGAEGGRVGPDLTRIGAIRSAHDLLESILWPSSTFAQGYEPYAVATANGQVFIGLIACQDADVLVLRSSSGAETRLRRDEVEELRRSETSLMPEGLARALTREELHDLLAFLRSQN
jgi:putative membrane-bound dehydrogenase-like protein